MTGKKNPNRITVDLDDQQLMNLEMLLAKYGGRPSAYIKVLLQRAFEKEFGGYKGRVKDGTKPAVVSEPKAPEQTPAQICELRGGTVQTRDGVVGCWEGKVNKFTGGDMGVFTPLELL